MKSVLLSIKPPYCVLIASGKKTVEVRKTKPTIEVPFKCFIYCTKGKSFFFDERFECETKGNGKVIGEFVCRLITGLKANNQIQAYYNGTRETCLTEKEIVNYAKGKMIYYWHISDLEIYDKPKELLEFIKPCENDLYCEECAMFRSFEDKCGNSALQIKRPPQSWCYVEELK